VKLDESRRLYERARRYLAGGVSTVMRADAKPVPLYFDRGSGPRLVDVDGNVYLEYTLAFGPTILGHGHPAVVKAVVDQMGRGQTYGAQHRLEPLVAEQIHAMVPCADMVVFSTTGTEAVQIAIRLARAATGRTRFVKFEGHYHGWFDNVLVSYRGTEEQLGPRERPTPVLSGRGQLEEAAREAMILPWNDLDLVERTLREQGDDVAAILTEPIMCNSGGSTPLPGFLEGLRALCDRYGIVLIFDEVITGFRIALGGAQEYFGVTPDLAVFGKALGGGLPVSAVAGRRPLMDLIARHEVVHAGTFNGNPIALAAAHATLEVLSADGGAIYPRLRQLGGRLREGVLAALAGTGIPAVAAGVGPAFTVSIGLEQPPREYREFLQADGASYGRFAEALLAEGVLCLQRGMWYLSTAHTEEDVDKTIEAAAAAAAAARLVTTAAGRT
jgi:glutamate-1-semialdehyde 2,1-aminomutase